MFKKNVFIFIFVFIFLSVTIYSFRYFGQKIIYDNERVIWQTKAEMIDNISDYDYEYLVFGDSRTLAINPLYIEDKFGVKLLNLSAGGSSLPSIYYFIKRALENERKKSKIKEIFIGISPQNISATETRVDTSLGERFIRFVSTEKEVDELSKYAPGFKKKYLKIFRFPFKDSIYKRDHTIIFGIFEILTGGPTNEGLREVTLNNKGFAINNRFTYNYKSIDSVVSSTGLANYLAKRKLENNRIHDFSYDYMKKIKDILDLSKIKYSFFIAPLPKKRKSRSDLFFGKTIEVYNILNKRNINNNILLLDRKYFKDPSHLNYNGSILFNNYFYECVINDNCTDTYKFKILKGNNE